MLIHAPVGADIVAEAEAEGVELLAWPGHVMVPFEDEHVILTLRVRAHHAEVLAVLLSRQLTDAEVEALTELRIRRRRRIEEGGCPR